MYTKGDLESIKIAIKELQERNVLLRQQIRTNTAKTNELNMLSAGGAVGMTRGTGSFTGGARGGMLSGANSRGATGSSGAAFGGGMSALSTTGAGNTAGGKLLSSSGGFTQLGGKIGKF